MACEDKPTLTILFDRLVDALLSMTSPQTAAFALQSVILIWLVLTVGSSVVASLIMIPQSKRRSERLVTDWPSVGVVVPCFMPNEHEIIRETVELVANSTYSGELTIHIPYNGGAPDANFTLPAEINGRSVLHYSVDGSTSKAANINQALKKLDESVLIVAIFDADHHVAYDTVEQLVRVLVNRSTKCVCVQGSVLPLRGGDEWRVCWLKWLVVGMEFVGCRFYIPGVALLTGSAWFAGANAAWRRKDLEELSLSIDAVTEDIEISLRTMLDGRRILIAPWVVVEELCPPSLSIFVRQRLRWALGWEQASLKHVVGVLKKRKRLLVVLLSRYINIAAGLFAFINLITRSLDFVNERRNPNALPVMLLTSAAGYTGAAALLCVTIVSITDGEGVRRLLQIFSFMALAPVFVCWQIFTVLSAWATLLCFPIQWIPTTRRRGATVHRIAMPKAVPGRALRMRVRHRRLATAEEA
jgi:cellulose synthase/poly-beta-1,6-N-acetylglucosamine synthase-like glycosyltransferase